jgi:hypothetical protein
MKRTKAKLKRMVKYYRVSYEQSDKQHRLFMGMFGLMVLVYAWWIMLAL